MDNNLKKHANNLTVLEQNQKQNAEYFEQQIEIHEHWGLSLLTHSKDDKAMRHLKQNTRNSQSYNLKNDIGF
jgi:Tat protein secretion system quality control protein TatD with DNase activity